MKISYVFAVINSYQKTKSKATIKMMMKKSFCLTLIFEFNIKKKKKKKRYQKTLKILNKKKFSYHEE